MLKPVELTAEDKLWIIDQTLLPGELRRVELRTRDQLVEAIQRLRVRGAPAIGVCAAYGLYLLARQHFTAPAPDCRQALAQLLEDMELVERARPTAVNLAGAVARMRQVCRHWQQQSWSQPSPQPKALLAALRAEAVAIAQQEESISLAIAEQAQPLLRDGMGLLTHCNAGALATLGLGTALAPIYLAHRRGLKLRVYCDETRPLLQGARLTAWELAQAGLEPTLICDNMAAALMASGQIDAVLVGADRVAANGDVANKIGTLSLAINARYFGVPFYVCAPSSTLDPACPEGAAIPIEQRPASEITDLWYAQPQAPPGVAVWNPAFDVTPAALVTALITEKGIELGGAAKRIFFSPLSKGRRLAFASQSRSPALPLVGGAAKRRGIVVRYTRHPGSANNNPPSSPRCARRCHLLSKGG